ncbi:MAG: hypothetical protein NC123_18410 [Butyrivibrio sp.]|nr:hypothetical protein [Butyrivibrio sp.]
MNYVWEALLKAREQGIAEDDLRFLPAGCPSPYMEVSFEDLNKDRIEDLQIKVNPLYRFNNIFSGIFTPDIREYTDTRTIFLDVFLHYVAGTDLLSGMHRQEYYYWFMAEELQKGIFGKKAAEAFVLFQPGQQRRIVMSLLGLYQAGHYKEIFISLVKALYENAIVYEGRDRAETMFLYIGRRETGEERKRVGLLIDTFLPVNESVEVFYDKHFGIMDMEETMALDRILLI